MKIIHKDLKKGEMKLEVQRLDDLWHLTYIVEPGDHVSSKTLRKLKMGGDEETGSVVRKPVFLEIQAEKIQFGHDADALRVTGPISQGPEDVPLGSYHTISLEPGTRFLIRKMQWLSYQLEKVETACQPEKGKVLLVVFDRDEAHFAMLKEYGYQYLSGFQHSSKKKGYEGHQGDEIYPEIISRLKEYVGRMNPVRIVVGSPSFWKDELLNRVTDDSIRKKIVPAGVSSADRRGFDELIKREEVQQALRDEHALQEVELVENLLTAIAKGDSCAYGIDEVRRASESGAVEKVLVTDTLIMKMREEERYHELESIMKQVEQYKGSVHIITHEHEGGQKLDGIGGLGALLRFPIS